MAVAIQAKIGYVVVMRAAVAKNRRAFQKFITVKEKGAITFAVAVIEDGCLGGEAEHRIVLAVHIEDKNIIFTQALRHIIEPAIGVFFQAAEPGQIVLK